MTATLDFRVTDMQGATRGQFEPRSTCVPPRDRRFQSPIEVFARIELFAGPGRPALSSPCATGAGPAPVRPVGAGRCGISVSDPRPWCRGERTRRAGPLRAETGMPLDDVRLPFEIYQESSGGEQWNGPVHRNREGRVSMRASYRLRSGQAEQVANRASPVIVVETRAGEVAVAVPQFGRIFPVRSRSTAPRLSSGCFRGNGRTFTSCREASRRRTWSCWRLAGTRCRIPHWRGRTIRSSSIRRQNGPAARAPYRS